MKNELLNFQTDIHRKLRAQDLNPKLESLSMPIVCGEDIWVFPSKSVVKVIAVEKIARVPGAGAHIAGVTSLSGIIYTLLDFNVLLGCKPIERSLKSRILFLERSLEESPVAILVERVLPLSAGPFLLNADSQKKEFSSGTANIPDDARPYYMVDIERFSNIKSVI